MSYNNDDKRQNLFNEIEQKYISQPNIETIKLPISSSNSIELDILRLDLIHPIIGGNKWYKLKGHFDSYLLSSKKKIIVSCGGTYSNHLYALGFLCHKLDLEATFFIREGNMSSRMLIDLKQWGIKYIFISRGIYRKRYQSQWWHEVLSEYGYCYDDFFVIEEGGSGALAMQGINELLQSLPIGKYNEILLPFASGGTYAGCMTTTNKQVKITGISVVDDINKQLSSIGSWLDIDMSLHNKNNSVEDKYNCGGYMKFNSGLLSFMEIWFRETKIPIEPIYSGKLFYAIFLKLHAIKNNDYSKILAIHTGGLQALHGLEESFKKYNFQNLWNNIASTIVNK